jgi:HTH-type transcriptional regulator / antitoxin HigA
MAQMVVKNTPKSATLDPVKYGRLCAKTLPKVIANDEELDRMADCLEELGRSYPDPAAAPREVLALADLLTKLIDDYDDLHYPLPELEPHKMLAYLMEQRGLKQADLVDLIGSRAQVSDIVTGKRAISKAQAKKLAQFFKLSTDLFI